MLKEVCSCRPPFFLAPCFRLAPSTRRWSGCIRQAPAPLSHRFNESGHAVPISSPSGWFRGTATSSLRLLPCPPQKNWDREELGPARWMPDVSHGLEFFTHDSPVLQRIVSARSRYRATEPCLIREAKYGCFWGATLLRRFAYLAGWL